ncbi:hypothetical protein [Shewanella litorisediminis]|uniref:Uncharacterized protein n=1 Tax=Shewanella litorisediminis TaxID=1173586 RepID=A0ABX7G5A5_9GAMM|nr:hypothetical protein [Shewanella litorisediminis]MCL2918049.1 hypothetical protein [Shewanella litorisediminis]QRH02479.1 hypothetical protein JQC75_03365 [Shewanella litorisediminis]
MFRVGQPDLYVGGVSKETLFPDDLATGLRFDILGRYMAGEGLFLSPHQQRK